MKQIIPFIKDLMLDSKISEITSIALEHNLKMENNDSITGTFIISGKYKINDISRTDNFFEKSIDFDITLDDKYDTSKVVIDIDNFYYEIINEECLRVHIDVLIDNLVYLKKEVKKLHEEKKEVVLINEELEKNKDVRNELKKEEEERIMENKFIEEDKKDITNTNETITSNIIMQKEEYVTYKVHIVRENDTIDSIKELYNVTKEDLEKYNNLENIMLGNKLIIPKTYEQ